MWDLLCCQQKNNLTETVDEDVTRPHSNSRERKSGWTSRFFKCFRRGRVAPTPGADAEQKTPPERHRSPAKAAEETPYAPYRVDPVMEFKAGADDEDQPKAIPSFLPSSEEKKKRKEENFYSRIWKHFFPPQKDCLGFPNPCSTCYMNSGLQSLITMADFTRDFSRQKAVWSSAPEAELIRRFMNVVGCRRSADSSKKLKALHLFKSVLSVQAPELQDDRQKDAHEFLTTVVDQIRGLSPLLQARAAIKGRSYRCPVEDHLVFKMQNTRTCKGCGAGSSCEEEFTNLSLDLTPQGSVQEMLQGYLKETELEYRCDCGAGASGRQTAFLTLPRVLILHLKRFSYTLSLWPQKLNDPVDILRELNVTSSQGDGRYSLVSVISHLGSGVNSGHYISNGPNPDVDPDDPTDSWLTFNDARVSHTSGDTVCVLRQRSAYVLLYQRRAVMAKGRDSGSDVAQSSRKSRPPPHDASPSPRPQGGGVPPREPGSSRGFFL